MFATANLVVGGLADSGAEPVRERVVRDGRIVTGAGVSAGIDMALTVLAEATDHTTAQTVQLAIEYAPEPPFDTGSPRTAPAALREPAPRLIGCPRSGRPFSRSHSRRDETHTQSGADKEPFPGQKR